MREEGEPKENRLEEGEPKEYRLKGHIRVGHSWEAHSARKCFFF